MAKDLNLSMGEGAALMACALYVVESGVVMHVLTPDGMFAAREAAVKLEGALRDYVEGQDFPRVNLQTKEGA